MQASSPQAIAIGPIERWIARYSTIKEGFIKRYVHLEITFWEFAIPLLEESTALHHILWILYSLIHTYQSWSYVPKALFWLGAGLTVGLMIGLY